MKSGKVTFISKLQINLKYGRDSSSSVLFIESEQIKIDNLFLQKIPKQVTLVDFLFFSAEFNNIEFSCNAWTYLDEESHI